MNPTDYVVLFNGTRQAPGLYRLPTGKPAQDADLLYDYTALAQIAQSGNESSALRPAQSQRKGTLREA